MLKFIAALLVFCGAAIGIAYYTGSFGHREPHLRKFWEGVAIDLNHRDVGQSLNACLGSNTFATGEIQRSNRYFSGWSCNKVGNPETIVQLNFEMKRQEISYCTRPDGDVVAEHFNQGFEIKDIEDFEQWNDPGVRTALCQSVALALRSIAEGKNVLVHCDVGRDRTGAFSALLAATLADMQQKLDDKVVDAIECDYEKTKKLEGWKKGHMKAFVNDLKSHYGGPVSFLREKCGFTEQSFEKASQKFLKSL